VGLVGQFQHVSLVRFSLAREEVDEEFSIGHLGQFDLVFAMDVVLFNLSISLVKTLQQAKQSNLVIVPVDLL
jgi:hypothetical protein